MRIVRGEEHLKTFQGTHVLGFDASVTFCDTCGTSLYKHVAVPENMDYFAVPTGALDAVDDKLGVDVIPPEQEGFLSHKAKWLPAFPGLEYFSSAGSK